MKGIGKEGQQRCGGACVTAGELRGGMNKSLVLQRCRSARAFTLGDILHAQNETRGCLQQWHWSSSTKVIAWRRRDPQALTRVSPSTWTPELSHPGMGFNAVPILAALGRGGVGWDRWLGNGAWQRHDFPSGEEVSVWNGGGNVSSHKFKIINSTEWADTGKKYLIILLTIMRNFCHSSGYYTVNNQFSKGQSCFNYMTMNA